MNRFAQAALAVALACAVATPAAALNEPKRSASDHRVRYASFARHGARAPVRCGVGHALQRLGDHGVHASGPGGWRAIGEPPLLWFNTALLAASSLALALPPVALLVQLEQIYFLGAFALSFILVIVARLISPVPLPGLFIVLVPAVMALIFTGTFRQEAKA